MKKLLVTTTLFSILTASAALAESPKFYVGGNVKYLKQHNSDLTVNSQDAGYYKYDAGLGLAVQGGIDISGNRVELEIARESYDASDVEDKYTTSSAHINYFHDFKLNDKFSPYVGGGLGLTKVEIDSSGITLSDTVPSYQIGAGIGFNINESNVVSAGYKYRGALKNFEFSGVNKLELEYSASMLEIGYRFTF